MKHILKNKGDFITIKEFANKNKISKYNAKKEIDKLINYGIIEKYYNRFYYLTTDYRTDTLFIQKNLINKAKINLQIAKLLNSEMIFDKLYMAFIDTSNFKITIYFPLKKQKLEVKTFNNITGITKILFNRNKIKRF